MTKALRASSLTLLMASLCACGGGSGTASPQPNTGNIPNLATRPTPQASQLKKVRVTGTVFNSLTGSPVEKAEVLIQVLATPSASPLPGATPAPAGIPTTPPPTNAAPIPTPPPVATPTPGPNTGPDLMSPTPVPAVPTTLAPTPASPLPFTPPPTNATIAPKPPDLPPNEGGTVPGAWLPGLQGLFTARGAQSASFQLAQAAQPSPSAPSDEPNLFRTDTNNKGKFYSNDVSDGRYLITISAPGYRTLSLTDVNITDVQVPLTPLDGPETIDVVGMVLSPAAKPVTDAMVSPTYALGQGASVPETTNAIGEFVLPQVPYGVHSFVAYVLDNNQQIKQMGLLTEVPISDKTLKTTRPAMIPRGQASPAEPEESAEPEATPTKSPKPAKSPKPGKSPKPSASPSAEESASPNPDASASPSPAASAETESRLPGVVPSLAGALNGQLLAGVEEAEEKAENTYNLVDQLKELITGEKPRPEDDGHDHDIYPVISLHSVLNQMTLAGTVDLPEGFEPENVEVYLTLPPAKKGDVPHEAYMMSQPLETEAEASPAASPSPSPTPAAGKKPPLHFRLNLPSLDKDQSYHLLFTATKDTGEITYHHLYNLDKGNEELQATFLPAAAKISLEKEDVNAVPPVPTFSWEGVPGAEVYHLNLVEGSGKSRRVIWDAWTKDTQIRFPLTAKAERLQERKTYVVSVEALKGLHPATNDIKKQYSLPAYQAIWTDLSRQTHASFEVVE